jgi:23S rRNA-/tRNA-specific pseudouridylate synthase
MNPQRAAVPNSWILPDKHVTIPLQRIISSVVGTTQNLCHKLEFKVKMKPNASQSSVAANSSGSSGSRGSGSGSGRDTAGDVRSALEDVLLKENRVLYKDDHYLVIDKPCDVRMNGDFDVTVEKLVLAAFPALKCSDLKWIHQLDYATSGVLWYVIVITQHFHVDDDVSNLIT